MKFDDRYASAIRTGNLRSSPETTSSASDVVGAAGLAGKSEPLATALMRLFSGDNHASREIVQILGAMADGKAHRMRWGIDRIEITRTEAEDMGRAVLAWYRHGTCQPCQGHGFALIKGAPSLSGNHCPACRGAGKIPFERQFRPDRVPLAQWLLSQVERQAAKAGPLAMAKLAPRMRM